MHPIAAKLSQTSNPLKRKVDTAKRGEKGLASKRRPAMLALNGGPAPPGSSARLELVPMMSYHSDSAATEKTAHLGRDAILHLHRRWLEVPVLTSVATTLELIDPGSR
jgi:hypothetical protein